MTYINIKHILEPAITVLIEQDKTFYDKYGNHLLILSTSDEEEISAFENDTQIKIPEY